MPNISFTGLLIVSVVAFAAPLLLGLSPARRLPAVVLEIVAGIVIGPSVLGWVKVDLPISEPGRDASAQGSKLLLITRPWPSFFSSVRLISDMYFNPSYCHSFR